MLVVIVWKYFGFHMMLYIAGLQGIDRSLLEAAEIDGASAWQRFRHITLPLLGPMIRLSVFFSVVGSLQLFDIIVPLTGGGPFDTTHTMVSFLYYFGITRMRVGFGSAVGVVLFVICVAFAFGYSGWSCAMTETASLDAAAQDVGPRRRPSARAVAHRALRRAGRARGDRPRSAARDRARRLQGARRTARQPVRPAARLGVAELLGHPPGARYWQVLGNSLLIALADGVR